MRTFWNFVILVVLAGLAILLGIALGERGAWYFAWLLGLPLAAAFAVLNAIWFELMDDEATRRELRYRLDRLDWMEMDLRHQLLDVQRLQLK